MKTYPKSSGVTWSPEGGCSELGWVIHRTQGHCLNMHIGIHQKSWLQTTEADPKHGKQKADHVSRLSRAQGNAMWPGVPWTGAQHSGYGDGRPPHTHPPPHPRGPCFGVKALGTACEPQAMTGCHRGGNGAWAFLVLFATCPKTIPHGGLGLPQSKMG